MSITGRLPKAWLAAAVLAAALLAGCGNGEPDATGAGTSGGAATEETAADTSGQIRSNVKTGPLRVTGQGPEQFPDIPDNYTILESDKEASRRAMEEAALVVHGYLVAHVQYDWAKSCSYLNDWALKEVTVLGSHFKQVAGKDCPTIIAYLLGKVPRRKTVVASEVEAGSLRVRREGGHFFYRGGGVPYTISVERDEDGNWKLAEILVIAIKPPPS